MAGVISVTASLYLRKSIELAEKKEVKRRVSYQHAGQKRNI
jgi:hypothetical protein